MFFNILILNAKYGVICRDIIEKKIIQMKNKLKKKETFLLRQHVVYETSFQNSYLIFKKVESVSIFSIMLKEYLHSYI